MKRYIYTGGSNLIATKDNFETIEQIGNTYGSIDWMWLIKEDGELTFNGKRTEVKAGQMVVCLYSCGLDREVIVLDCPEWFANCDRREQEETKERNCCTDSCIKRCKEFPNYDATVTGGDSAGALGEAGPEGEATVTSTGGELDSEAGSAVFVNTPEA